MRDMVGKSGRKSLNIMAVVFWLIIWHLLASVLNRDLLIPVPTPAGTVSAMFRLACTAQFLRALLMSFVRIFIGFALALVLGSMFGILSARWPAFRVAASPLLAIIRAIPVAAFTIILFLWIGRDKIPSAIAFFTVIPIVWANAESGVLSLDRGLVEMGRVFGMGRQRIFREIIIPGIRPFLVSSVASGMGFAWKSGCAAEIICRTSDSLGNLLWTSKSAIDYDEVFAVAFVIILLSTILQRLAKMLMKKG